MASWHAYPPHPLGSRQLAKPIMVISYKKWLEELVKTLLKEWNCYIENIKVGKQTL
jgi:hypothetical protein